MATVAPRGSLPSFEVGQIWNPYAPITGGHSLSPRSLTRFCHSCSRELPAGSYYLVPAQKRAYHVPILADKASCGFICPVSICLSPGSAIDDVFPVVTEISGYSPFGQSVSAAFAPQSLRGLHHSSVTLCLRNLPGTSHRTAAGSVGLPHYWGEPSVERHVAPRASHPTVTSRACRSRQLLVVQQVTASNIKCDKARMSFAVPFLYHTWTATRVAPQQLTVAHAVKYTNTGRVDIVLH
jgi:hypothetical protein